MPRLVGFRRRPNVIDRLSEDSNLHALIVKKLITAGGRRWRGEGGHHKMVRNLPSCDVTPPAWLLKPNHVSGRPLGCSGEKRARPFVFLFFCFFPSPSSSLVTLNSHILPSHHPSSKVPTLFTSFLKLQRGSVGLSASRAKIVFWSLSSSVILDDRRCQRVDIWTDELVGG